MRAREKLFVIFSIFCLSATPVSVNSQESYFPSELVFTVTINGYVEIVYSVDVDPTKARIEIPIFGDVHEDLFVEDQDGLILDYTSKEDVLTIDTLGSVYVVFTYATQDLTNKTGKIWVLSFSTPISSSIILPERATVVSLNPPPLTMGSLDEKILISMPAGELKIEYTVGVVGTREYALAVIIDAEKTIEAIGMEGVIIQEPDELLKQAYEAYNEGFYTKAEQFAEDAKTSAQNMLSAALTSAAEIEHAETEITDAENSGRTIGLSEAKDLLQQALSSYAEGNYFEAEALAKQAKSIALSAEKVRTNWSLWVIIGVVGAAALILLFARARRSTYRKTPETVEPERKFDIEAIFDSNPNLRIDDKEVIRFLANAGGEAFAAEIRERFDIPRTSLWRMIRRLEREDIIEIRNIGGQSLVVIRQKYLKESS